MKPNPFDGFFFVRFPFIYSVLVSSVSKENVSFSCFFSLSIVDYRFDRAVQVTVAGQNLNVSRNINNERKKGVVIAA